MINEPMSRIEKARAIIERSSKIVVVTGAGVSTLSGIPDFRSPETGLYSKLEQYDLPYPEAIFDLTYLLHNPKPFFDLAAELMGTDYKPSAGHFFVAALEQKGKLRRLYTQNIDGLDSKAGTRAVVECHGSFSTAQCTVCHKPAPIAEVKVSILDHHIPRCPCGGIIKPDIVFFGEGLPDQFFDHYQVDLSQCDAFIAMGSSLTVQPVGSLVLKVKPGVPRILINRDATPYEFDIELIGDIGDICEALINGGLGSEV